MICVVCKQDKNPDSFNWRNKSEHKKKRECQACDRRMKREYYTRNREKVIQDNQQRKKHRILEFNEWKKTLYCRLCGENDMACMDFHHLDMSAKEKSISDLLNSGSLRKLERELSKCVCLCRNCHAKVHAYGLQLDETSEHFLFKRA